MMKKTIISFLGIALFGISIANISFNSNKNSDIHTKLNAIINIAYADTESEGGAGSYLEGYYNETIIIYNYSGNLGALIGTGRIPIGINVNIGASGALTFCKDSFWWWKKCYLNLNGWVPFTT